MKQGLTGCGHSPAAEIFQVNFFRYFLAYFKVRFNFLGFGKADLIVFPDVFRVVVDDLTETPDFQVTFVGIDNDIKIIIGDVFLSDHVAEDVFQDPDHGRAINVLLLRKISKRFDKGCGVHHGTKNLFKRNLYYSSFYF